MSNTVTYDFTPNQNVYVINTLGPNQEYPYWGYPYGDGYGWYGGYPYGGYPYYGNGSYPRGFTSTTPAIESGVVLQGRILITASTNSPTIMYDIRLNGEMGTTCFPQNMVFPATAGTSGYQTINYGGTLTSGTVVALPSALYSAIVYIDGAPAVVTLNLSTMTNIAAFILAFDAAIGPTANVTIVGGNLQVTSTTVGVN